MKRQPFKLHLPGLLKVLAEHLYSNRQVAIRELIQNAHDSCVRRAVEGGEAHYRPRIQISIDAQRRTLLIRDNGCGLTETEIDGYLATIGRSYTRDLRERLAILSRDEAASLIGQFGFGFLSAFLIASEVTLTTRSYREGSQALCWSSQGDEHYTLAPATRDTAGTTLELRIKPQASFLLQRQLLLETIQKYGDFLPLPIYLNDDPHPVNIMTPPWEAKDPHGAAAAYVERTFHISDPLCIIPLKDHTIDLGHDSITLPIKGFLFVPPSSVASIREYGDLLVFIRKMFICEDERELLPPWARFVRGVIDCPVLQPTASREGIHQDDTFEAVQQALEEQLGQALRLLAEEDPITWKRIVRGHADVITGWAARDHEFFDQVADIVAFQTSRGLLSLPEYLRLTGGTIYYVARELGSLQEQLLAEGHDVPVIDASWFAVTPFLERYAAQHPDVELVRMDGDASQLLRPVPEAPFADLLRYYRDHDVRARVASFRPAEVPALILYPQDADFISEARQALDAGELPAPLADLIGESLDALAADDAADPESEDDLRGTLYLNAACPLLRRLSESPPGDAQRGAVLMLIYQLARLFAGRMLTAADATLAFKEAGAALEELLS